MADQVVGEGPIAVPAGTVDPETAFTLAVSVIGALICGLAGVIASVVAVAVWKVNVPNAVARLLASTDPNPVARS